MQFVSRNIIQKEVDKEESFLILLSVILLVILPIAFFVNLRNVLYVILLVVELLFLMVSMKDVYKPTFVPFTLAGVALFLYLVCCAIGNGGNSSERLIQTILIVLTTLSMGKFKWTQNRLDKLNLLFELLIFGSLVLWALEGFKLNYYSAFYEHSNGFANVLICAIAIQTLVVANRDGNGVRIREIAYYAICAALLFAANSRSALVAVVLFAGCFVLLNYFGKGKSLNNISILLFGAFAFVMIAFSLIYPSLYGTQLGFQLEDLSREYLGKNFFSGREIVWNMVLGAVEGNELFGLGLFMDPALIYNTQFSSHNLYLQTILQSGVIGLILVFVLLLCAIKIVAQNNSFAARVCISLILCLIVHEGFEVTLTQNNLSFGLMYWAIIGVSFAICSKNIKKANAL